MPMNSKPLSQFTNAELWAQTIAVSIWVVGFGLITVFKYHQWGGVVFGVLIFFAIWYRLVREFGRRQSIKESKHPLDMD